MVTKLDTLLHIHREALSITNRGVKPRENDSWAKAIENEDIIEILEVNIAEEHKANFAEMIGGSEGVERYSAFLRKHGLGSEDGFMDSVVPNQQSAEIDVKEGKIKLALKNPFQALHFLVGTLGEINLPKEEHRKLKIIAIDPPQAQASK